MTKNTLFNAPEEVEQLKDRIALLVLTGTPVKEIIRISGLKSRSCRAIVRKVQKEIKALGVNELKALINTKFRQSLANHTLNAKALVSEFFESRKNIDTMRLTLTNTAPKGDTAEKVTSKAQEAIDKRVDRLLKIGQQIGANDKNLAE